MQSLRRPTRTGIRAPGGTNERAVAKRKRSDISRDANSPSVIGNGGIAAWAGGRSNRAAPIGPEELQLAGTLVDEQKKSGSKNESRGADPGRPSIGPLEIARVADGKFGLEVPPTIARRGDSLPEVRRLAAASASATARTDAANELLTARPERQTTYVDPHPCQIGIAARHAMLLQRGLPGVDPDSVRLLEELTRHQTETSSGFAKGDS